LEKFQQLKEEYGDKAKIALDEDLVGYKKTYRPRFELQYWRGPKFNDDLSTIPDGVTVHGSSEADRSINNILRAEFGWFEQGGKRSFVCEEIRDTNTVAVGSDKLACRYVHSMVSPTENKPDHLDGAVRIYVGSDIEERKKVDIKAVERTAEYKKLWRVDGAIPINIWKSLIGDYFRDNPLILEYFGGKLGYESEDIALKEVGEKQEIETFQYPTPPFKDGDGIRISMSYGSKSENKKEGIFVYSPDTLTVGEETFRQIENNAFEILKCLHRDGIQLSMAENMKTIKYDDNLINCPVIQCLGNDALEKYGSCCKAIHAFLEHVEKNEFKFIFTINFEIEYETTVLSLSVAGTGADIVAWFAAGQFQLPKAEDDLASWSEANRDWLTEKYPKSNDSPDLSSVLKRNGKLYLDRKILDHEDYTFTKSDKDFDIVIRVPKNLVEDEDEFFKRCTVASCMFIDQATCSKCEKPYLSCLCSKFLEEGVVQVIEKCAPFSCFFTWLRKRV
jgi:hypothetical protein